MVNTIASHHGDVEAESVIAVIVAAADALECSASVLVVSLESYIKRLHDLKKLLTVLKGYNSFCPFGQDVKPYHGQSRTNQGRQNHNFGSQSS